jgi:hypothetical protein
MQAVIATALLFLLAAGCALAPAPSSSALAPSASPSPSPALAAWLPPWSGAETPAEVVTRSSLPFRGVEQGAGPGIAINAEVRGCFLAAYREGSGAEFASIQTSIEGDPIATITRTLPGGGVELLVDATQDEFGEKAWRRTTCSRLVNDQREVFAPDGCDEGVVLR